jgi:hypothetical protein
LLVILVRGKSRLPVPPARTTPFISNYYCMVLEPSDGESRADIGVLDIMIEYGPNEIDGCVHESD